ncbi:MAG: NAD(P)H-hydrate dehydratase [Clostridiales bacterium]|nr:NAD(P)H-hydrate dehydratase [Clostridiales bacterium]
MTKILTCEQMRDADEYTIKGRGVPSQTLMERAGKALAAQAEKMSGNGRILCVCGGGNNGGDGFICARLLRCGGYEIDAVCMANRFSADCQIAKDNYVAAGGKVWTEFPQKEYSLVIDCLLGTGFHGALGGIYADAIHRINDYKKGGAKVLSADIPSGVNGDNGSVEGVAVKADATVCLGEIKAGVYLGDGIDYSGEKLRADIGIAVLEKEYATIIEREDVANLLPKRNRNTHKGSYGKAAIVAGSMQYTGAAYLSAAACLRAGAGYTTLFLPKSILPYYVLRLPEVLLQSVCEGEKFTFFEQDMEKLLSYDSIAYGMGMGCTEEVAKGARYLLENYEGKLILDADGINALAAYENVAKVFKSKRCDVLITPHVKEFSRLSGERVESILQGGMYAPTAFAKENNVTVALKNAVTLITDGERVFVNVTGNAGQAKGGSGDVLSGVLAGLCAQGFSTLDSARIGGYIVGKAADIAVKKQGEYALIASDVIEKLGEAFLSLRN